MVSTQTHRLTSDRQWTVKDNIGRALPPLAALAYPALVWCGPGLSSLFLVICLVIPLAGLSVAHRLDHHVHPRSRWIAFFVTGAPALYTLLGGWLDFQRALPFRGLHVWIALWLVAAGIALWERASPRSNETSPRSHRRLSFAHGVSALLIACFAVAHLVNHLGGLWGGERHVAIMHSLRLVYRHPIVETLLLGSVLFQVFSGARLLARKLPQATDWVDTLQVWSAIYLLLFFLSHVSAALRVRHLRHIETDWTWASADLLTDPWRARLVPYYFLSVVALGVHGGAGVRQVMMKHGRSTSLTNQTFRIFAVGAVLLSALITVGLVRG